MMMMSLRIGETVFVFNTLHGKRMEPSVNAVKPDDKVCAFVSSNLAVEPGIRGYSHVSVPDHETGVRHETRLVHPSIAGGACSGRFP